MTMANDWRQFLKDAGAVFDNGVIQHFGDRWAETRSAADSDVIAALNQTGLISVSGQDASTLLQGQLTNDILAVTEANSQLSAWCNIKGRVVVRFRVWRQASGYRLELPVAQVERTIERLRLYVLRAQVEIADISDQWVQIGVSGERAAERLAQLAGSVPTQPDAVVHAPACTIIRLHGERPRFSVFAPADASQALWARCAPVATPVGADAWRSLDIRAGITDLPPELSDAFIPQMLNLQAINGLSFTKGCYTGQEIVARTQHLGRLKRRLFLAHVDGEASPRPSDPLYADGGGSGGQSVGTVVSASEAADGGWDLLAVIRIDSAEARTPIHLHHVLGSELELKSLPYPLEPLAA